MTSQNVKKQQTNFKGNNNFTTQRKLVKEGKDIVRAQTSFVDRVNSVRATMAY
jgi:hypothetical protein